MSDASKRVWLKWLALACRVILGAVFIYAGSLKIGQPGQFAADITNYNLLPESMSLTAAYLVPWLAVVCGLALILGWAKKGASILISGLTAAFIAALVVNLVRGVDIDCGCFGDSGTSITEALIRDMALIPLCLGALYAAFSSKASVISNRKLNGQ